MNFKNILIFVLGAGVGSFVTYRLLKDKYEALAEEEIESMKDVLSRGRQNSMEFDPDPMEMTEEEYTKLVSRQPLVSSIDRLGRRQVERRNYATPFIAGTTDALVTPDPYVISAEDYHETNLNHEKSSITYFNVDDTLVDESEEPIVDPESIIGDALMHFGESEEDPDIVYVRNEKLGIDYEVIRTEKSYQETVLGINLPVRKRGNHVKRKESDLE